MFAKLRTLALLVAISIGGMINWPAYAHPLDRLTIGGFGQTRGGIESLANPLQSDLRAAIRAEFAGAHFCFSNELTASFLKHIDVIVLGVASGGNAAITPLSAAEQTNLLSFVLSGGTAIILTDNDTFDGHASAPANASLLAPFGLAATGTVVGSQTTQLFKDNNPVANGPAGNITTLQTFYPGWFSTLGRSIELGRVTANSQPGVAYLSAGTLAAHSGAAVFFSDSNALIFYGRTSDDKIAILNSIALGHTH